MEHVVVPAYLPDTPAVRGDILEYCVEIERFDSQLECMLKLLESAGEMDNTIVIVTGDNGMPFPRAKANCNEDGIHVPLAIRWKARAPGGRTVDDLVGLVDLTATILDASGTKPPSAYPISGLSLVNLLVSDKQGLVDPTHDTVWAARERHSSSRHDNWTYPQRALRTPQFLCIRNFEPDRWPAGDPRELKADGTLGPKDGAYYDIDGAPTRNLLLKHADDPVLGRYFQLAVGKRPVVELFDITKDPYCLTNLAGNPEYEKPERDLSLRLMDQLEKTGDSRAHGNGDIWDTYKRYGEIRKFPPPEK